MSGQVKLIHTQKIGPRLQNRAATLKRIATSLCKLQSLSISVSLVKLNSSHFGNFYYLRKAHYTLRMRIKPLKNEDDYQAALRRIELLFDVQPGTNEGDELEVLSILVDHYERVHFPIESPDPIEAILFRMEQKGLQQKDLARVLGFKSRVSEVLNRRRKLTVGMIRKLSAFLNIPAEVLIREY